MLGDASLSSVGVLVGAGVMALSGWHWVDPLISIAISAVVVVGGWRLLREAVDVLLETVPPHVDVDGVEKALACIPRVTAVHDLHIWTVGSGMVALSAHLVVDEPSACENDTILVAAKRALVERFGIDHSTLQIESQALAGPGADSRRPPCASSRARIGGVRCSGRRGRACGPRRTGCVSRCSTSWVSSSRVGTCWTCMPGPGRWPSRRSREG